MEEELEKLYSGLKSQGLYTKSLDEFKGKYSSRNPKELEKLYSGLKSQGLYTKSLDEFKGKYFSESPKGVKAEVESGGLKSASANTGSSLGLNKVANNIRAELQKEIQNEEPANKFSQNNRMNKINQAVGYDPTKFKQDVQSKIQQGTLKPIDLSGVKEDPKVVAQRQIAKSFEGTLKGNRTNDINKWQSSASSENLDTQQKLQPNILKKDVQTKVQQGTLKPVDLSGVKLEKKKITEEDKLYKNLISDEDLKKLNINTDEFTNWYNDNNYENTTSKSYGIKDFGSFGYDETDAKDLRAKEERKIRITQQFIKHKADQLKGRLKQGGLDDQELVKDYLEYNNIKQTLNKITPNLNKFQEEEKQKIAQMQIDRRDGKISQISDVGLDLASGFVNSFDFTNALFSGADALLTGDKKSVSSTRDSGFFSSDEELYVPSIGQTFFSGKEVNIDGKDYRYSDGKVWDSENNMFIQPSELLLTKIKSKAKEVKEESMDFSAIDALRGLGRVTGNILGYATTSAVTGGGSTTMGIVGGLNAYSSTARQTMKELLDNGVNYQDALALSEQHGAIVGTAAGVLGKLAPNPSALALFQTGIKNSITNIAKDYGKNGLKATMKNMGAKTLNALKEPTLEGGQEFGEEIIQQLSAAEINKTLGEPILDDKIKADALATSVLLGFGGGGVFPSANALRNIKIKDTDKAKSIGLTTLANNYESFEKVSKELVDNGVISPVQLEGISKDVNKYRKYVNKMPSGINYSDYGKVIDLLQEKDDLTLEKQNIDSSFHIPLNNRLTEIQKEISTIQEKSEKPTQSTTETPQEEFDLTEKIKTDFDETLYDNKNQNLTKLGEEVKRRVQAGQDVTILTAREDTPENRQFIAGKLGINPDKIKLGLSPEGKAQNLEKGDVFYDDNAENIKVASKVQGVSIVNTGGDLDIELETQTNIGNETEKLQGNQELRQPTNEKGTENEIPQQGNVELQQQEEVINENIQEQEVDIDSYRVKKDKGGFISVTDKQGKAPSKPTEKKVLLKYADKVDLTKGNKYEAEGFSSDEDFYNRVASESNNPVELAELALATNTKEFIEENVSPEALEVVGYIAGNVKRSSFVNNSDANNITMSLAKTYLRKGGKGLDVLAQELSDEGRELTEQDLIDYMLMYPNGENDIKKEVRDKYTYTARNRFTEITGLPATDTFLKKAIEQQIKKEELNQEVMNNSLMFLTDKELQDLADLKEEYDKQEEIIRGKEIETDTRNIEGGEKQPEVQRGVTKEVTDEKIRFSTTKDQKPFETKDTTPATKDNIQQKFPDAIVVQSESELPQPIQSEIKQQKADGTIKGVYYGGEVYMVADNIKTLGEVEGTYRHEKLGHKGVTDYLGVKLSNYAKGVVNNSKGGKLERLKTIAKQYGLPTDFTQLTSEQRQELGEEYIAYVSENKSKLPNWWNEVVSVVRKALRDLGIDLQVSDSEIQALINKVEKSVKDGKGRETGDVRFKKSDKEVKRDYTENPLTDKEVFRKLYQSVKESTKSIKDLKDSFVKEIKLTLKPETVSSVLTSLKDITIDNQKETIDSINKQLESEVSKTKFEKYITAKTSVMELQKFKEDFSNYLNEKLKDTTLTPYKSEIERLINKVKNVNENNIRKLKSEVDNLFDKIENRGLYKSVSNAKSRMKSISRSKSNNVLANISSLAKSLSQIDDRYLNIEDKQKYLDTMNEVIKATKSVTDDKRYQMANENEVRKSIERLSQIAEDNYILNIAEQLGVTDLGLSKEEVLELWKSEDFDDDLKKKSETKQKIIRDGLLKMAEYSKMALADKVLQNITLDEKKQFDIIKRADLTKLTPDQLKMYTRIVDNIVINDDLSQAGNLKDIIEVNKKVVETVNKKNLFINRFDKATSTNVLKFLRASRDAMTSVDNLLARMAMTKDNAAFLRNVSGVEVLSMANVRTLNNKDKFIKALSDVLDDMAKTKIDIHSGENNLKRSIYGLLLQAKRGDKASMDNFKESYIRHSIEELKLRKESKNDKEAVRVMENILEELKDVKTKEELIKHLEKTDKENLQVIKTVSKLFYDHAPELRVVSEQYYNTPLEIRDIDEYYIPIMRQYVTEKSLSSQDPNEVANPSKDFNNAIRSSVKTGSLESRKDMARLQSGQVIMYDFDNAMIRKYAEQQYTINATSAVNQIKLYFNNKEIMKKLGGSGEWLKAMLANKITIDAGKVTHPESTTMVKTLSNIGNFFGGIGVARALGDITQPAKQITPVLGGAALRLGNDAGLIGTYFFTRGKDDLGLIQMSSVSRRSESQAGFARVGDNIKFEELSVKQQKFVTLQAEKLMNSLRGFEVRGKKVPITKENAIKMSMAALSWGDVQAAETTFLAYYHSKLRDLGVKDSDIDIKTEHLRQDDPIRKQAFSYATHMVNQTQTSSDLSEGSELLVSQSTLLKIIATLIIPFSTHSNNASVKVINNLGNAFTTQKGIPMSVRKENFNEALISIGEMTTFHSVKAFLLAPLSFAAYRAAWGDDEDEYDWMEALELTIKSTAWDASPLPDKLERTTLNWLLYMNDGERNEERSIESFEEWQDFNRDIERGKKKGYDPEEASYMIKGFETNKEYQVLGKYAGAFEAVDYLYQGYNLYNENNEYISNETFNYKNKYEFNEENKIFLATFMTIEAASLFGATESFTRRLMEKRFKEVKKQSKLEKEKKGSKPKVYSIGQ